MSEVVALFLLTLLFITFFITSCGGFANGLLHGAEIFAVLCRACVDSIGEPAGPLSCRRIVFLRFRGACAACWRRAPGEEACRRRRPRDARECPVLKDSRPWRSQRSERRRVLGVSGRVGHT